MKNNCSIKTRLLRILLIPLILGFVVVGFASFFNTKHEAEEIYDAQMTHFARMLELLTVRGAAIENSPINRVNVHYNASESSYEKNFAYRVWINNKLILKSLNSNSFGIFPKSEGFSDRNLNNKNWRFLVIKDGPLTVEVAEDYDARRDLINRVLASILIPLILLFPLILITVIYGLKAGLKPLAELSNTVSRRGANDLHKIDKENIPEEAAPLVDNINNLMFKVEYALEKEKRFTSYAAHELRTPLAALKAQVQVALRHKDLQKQREMFEEVTVGLDRMNHLVEQLLTFMRVQNGDVKREKVDVSKILQDLAKDYAPKATDKNIDLNVEIPPNIIEQANAEMLEVMLNNLISNAVKYTSEQGAIDIKLLELENGKYKFEISNNCKEISKEELIHIFDPFYRLQGEQETGAGIGLSIVKWVADNHNWKIDVNYDRKKLTFKVNF